MSEEKQSKFTEEQVAAAEKQIVEQSKRIEFYITEFSVELLASKMQNGDFEIPDYRREGTWGDRRKSWFIESLLMGIPSSFLFFWERPATGKLEIVDGSQRLRTIEAFLLGDFALGTLEEMTLLSGFRFKDLPESRQRKIKNRFIRGIVLNEHADDPARFGLFERINSLSKIPDKAEVRRGALVGRFQDLVISLAKESLFVNLTPISEKQLKERDREELVTRFFAYSDGLEGYKDRPSEFLFQYTEKMNAHFKQHPEEVKVYEQRFKDTMKFVARNFPWGFRKTAKGKASPRSRFEAIAIGSYLALQERPEIANLPIQVEEWLTNEEFREVTGADGANAIERLKKRIHFVRDHLLGVEDGRF